MDQLERVVETLTGVLPDYIDEYTLQAQLCDVLEQTGYTVSREVQLKDGASRIDLVITTRAFTRDIPAWTIGIEVKIAGRFPDVVRQLQRYAETKEFDALILVTTRAKHHHIPTELAGIPLRLVTYVTAGL